MRNSFAPHVVLVLSKSVARFIHSHFPSYGSRNIKLVSHVQKSISRQLPAASMAALGTASLNSEKSRCRHFLRAEVNKTHHHFDEKEMLVFYAKYLLAHTPLIHLIKAVVFLLVDI